MPETDLEEEELEELVEELDPLESPDAEEESPGEENVRFSAFDINTFDASIFPVLIVSKKLKILYRNPACETLFSRYFSQKGDYFIDIFGKAFDMDEIRAIRETLMKGENGYSWKGEAKLKSRDMVTLQTKVYIFPLGLDVRAPEAFVVLFDDVTEENKRLLRAVFLSLLEASKLKDNDTGKHITRVNFYSRRMAEELYNGGDEKYKRIDADFIDNIGFLASMHDVGKIGTPDDILNKEGPLSDWEWSVMREHTKNGAFILSTYPNPMAKEIALSHHERWDGAGYPFQLEQEMIPLAARIVTIADVYDALRMERSYKPSLPHDVTVAKMIEEKGTHFDPALIDVFQKIAGDFEKIYEANGD